MGGRGARSVGRLLHSLAGASRVRNRTLASSTVAALLDSYRVAHGNGLEPGTLRVLSSTNHAPPLGSFPSIGNERKGMHGPHSVRDGTEKAMIHAGIHGRNVDDWGAVMSTGIARLQHVESRERSVMNGGSESYLKTNQPSLTGVPAWARADGSAPWRGEGELETGPHTGSLQASSSS